MKVLKKGFTFGDWVPPIGEKNPNNIGDDNSTIYHFISTSLVAKISSILEDEIIIISTTIRRN